MRTDQPASAEIARLSPTSFEILRECSLRFGFEQQRSSGRSRGTPATRLGTVCHAVLDKAVRDGILHGEGWRMVVEQLWEAELALEQDRAADAGVTDEPNKWPGYQLKRARLFQVADRVREFLKGLRADAEVLTEEPLTAAEGRLYGRPDLLIRSAERHQIVDYKSGGVLDRDTNRPREAYIRQLQLYAYLEYEASGGWPTSAHLFPLHGAPVEIEVDPQSCLELATGALDALRRYNAQVPATPTASPALDHCRWCPYATVCEEFWKACDASWAPAINAVAGAVTKTFATPLGGITIYVDRQAGSVTDRTVVIKNIDPEIYGEARELKVGDEVAAVGLVADEQGSGYRLRGAGTFKAGRSAHAPNTDSVIAEDFGRHAEQADDG